MSPHLPSTSDDLILSNPDTDDEQPTEVIDPTLSRCLCIKGTFYSYTNLQNLLCETCFVQMSIYPAYPKGIKNYRHATILETEYKSERCYHCKQEILKVQAAYNCPMCVSTCEMAHMRQALNSNEPIDMINIKEIENSLTNSQEVDRIYPDLAGRKCGTSTYTWMLSLLLCQTCYNDASRTREIDNNTVEKIEIHQLLPNGVTTGMTCMTCHESTLQQREALECRKCIQLFMQLKFTRDHHFLTQSQ